MDYQFFAQQLRKPEGDFGRTLGHKLSISNRLVNLTTIRHLAPGEKEHILEIGMGNGAFCREILQSRNSVLYTGCDFSEVMVEEAITLNKEFISTERANFVLGNADQLPFSVEVFDRVFAVNTIYFWHPEKELSEIHRVLKPGGLLVLGLRTPEMMKQLPFVQFGFKTFTKSDLEKYLQKAGFEQIEILEEKEPDQQFEATTIKVSSFIAKGIKN